MNSRPVIGWESSMEYRNESVLKDCEKCLIRNLEADDAYEDFVLFQTTHGETDFLTSYPDENTYDEERQRARLERAVASERDVELGAFVKGRLLGTVSVEAVGSRQKVRHRCEIGISVLRESWGRGIGRMLMDSALECARQMGFVQVELEVVGGNERAIGLYRSLGFIEFGRNPLAFKSRTGAWQELVSMRLML